MSHFWEVPLLGQPVHLNTLIMVWSGMAALLVVCFLLTRELSVKPKPQQVLAESIYDFCRSITMATSGKRGDEFLFFVGSLFLFILTANFMGQLPLRLFELPHGEMMAATGDFNVPAALAVLTVIMYFFMGIKKKGLGYFKHYLSPLPMLTKGQPFIAKILYITFFWPFIFLNLLEDITRPGSLMIRLFFNILIGEILSGIAMSIAPLGLPVLVILLELFVAVIQAYIFAVLSSVYIGMMSEDHDNHDEEHAHDQQASNVSSLPAAA